MATLNDEIRSCIDQEGKLTLLPSRRRKKLIALAYIAGRIPENGIYSEREFNQLLNTLHTFGDPATLRRELYDHYLVDRDPDGSSYRLSPTRPTAEELIDRYCK